MALSCKVPKLTNPNIVVRTTNDSTEIEQANKLVFRNYVEAGFWENNEDRWRQNKYLHTPARHVFVMMDRDRLLGTMSIIVDSPEGLPSDSAQPALMQGLRAKGGKLAEVSAFAMDRSATRQRNLFFFLISYMFQFSFFYAEVDRLAVSCVSAHANFYESVLGFARMGGPVYYAYTRVMAFLLTLDIADQVLLANRYASNAMADNTLYHFLFSELQPAHHFPASLEIKRTRGTRETAQNLQKAA